MRYSILFSILLLLLFSCNKNKYTTAPQLKYVSANTKTLTRGQILQMTLSFTDAEGDITDKIFIQKIVRPCAAAPRGGFIDSSHTIPVFPTGKNQSGNILITYDYTSLNPLCNRNDTAIFKFVLRDQAKHVSDTAVSDPIVIIF